MKRILAVALLGAAVVSGCSTHRTVEDEDPRGKLVVPEDKIVDVDPTELEHKMKGTDAVPAEDTPPEVMVGKKNGVEVRVFKRELAHDPILGKKLQEWDAIAVNYTDIGKCVTPLWVLMDFEYVSWGPSEQYILPMSLEKLGVFKQQLWNLNGTWIAPAPSGYMKDMRVRDAIAGAKLGEECMFITPEEDVVKEHDIEM